MFRLLIVIALICAGHWVYKNVDFDHVAQTSIEKARTEKTINIVNQRRQEQEEAVKRALGE